MNESLYFLLNIGDFKYFQVSHVSFQAKSHHPTGIFWDFRWLPGSTMALHHIFGDDYMEHGELEHGDDSF